MRKILGLLILILGACKSTHQRSQNMDELSSEQSQKSNESDLKPTKEQSAFALKLFEQMREPLFIRK